MQSVKWKLAHFVNLRSPWCMKLAHMFYRFSNDKIEYRIIHIADKNYTSPPLLILQIYIEIETFFLQMQIGISSNHQQKTIHNFSDFNNVVHWIRWSDGSGILPCKILSFPVNTMWHSQQRRERVNEGSHAEAPSNLFWAMIPRQTEFQRHLSTSVDSAGWAGLGC